MKKTIIKNFIRESLLIEEVFGVQAYVYHTSSSPPETMIPAFLNDNFKSDNESDLMNGFGNGIYTFYGPVPKKGYGKYIYKLKVNLYDFISFDPDVTIKIYKNNLTPSEQAQKIGLEKDLIKKISDLENYQNMKPEHQGKYILKMAKILKGKVKGIIYFGHTALIYDPAVAVPVAWKKVKDDSWTSINKNDLKSSLKRSALGIWKTNNQVEIEKQIRQANDINTDVDDLINLSKSENRFVRQAVAKNEKLPIKTIQLLSDDTYPNVKISILRNPSTPTSIILKLQNDKNKDVKLYATRELINRDKGNSRV